MKKKDKLSKRELQKRFNNIILGGQKGMTMKVRKFKKSANSLIIKCKLTVDLNATHYFETLGQVIQQISDTEQRFKETDDYYEI